MPNARNFALESLESRRLLSSNGWDGPGLGSAELTYYIDDVPAEIDESAFRDAIDQAFSAWTDVADIDVKETVTARLRNSIDISFAKIDGAGGTLAEAYLPADLNPPRIAGDISIDREEPWEFGNRQRLRATDLTLVAVHEIGHALGLEHSNNPDSVMFDSVGRSEEFRSLHNSDVKAILALYAPAPPRIEGDFDADGSRSVTDIDLLLGQLGAAKIDREFDLNDDGRVDDRDRDVLIVELFDTHYGDANLDGVFDSSDLVTVFRSGRFEDQSGLASWESGDWDGDGQFDTGDIVMAFQRGGYVE